MGGGTPKIIKNIEDTVKKAGSKIEDNVRAVASNVEDEFRAGASEVEDTLKQGTRFANMGSADDLIPESLKGSPNWPSLGGGGKDGDVAPPVPEIPKNAEKKSLQNISSRRRAVARSRSIFTSPLGVGGQAKIARNYLTGQ